MKTKITLKLSALAAIAIVVAMAFAGLPTTAFDCTTPVDHYDATLKAGQDIDVGTVLVTFVSGYIHVDYEITAPDWYITEAHLAIAVVDDCDDCPGDIPTNKKGNPQIGHFPFTFDGTATDVNFEIAFDDENLYGGSFEYGDCLCIAAHAVVEKIVDGTTVDQQTGWGEGDRFTDSSWAMYFCFRVGKMPRLPTDKINFEGSHSGSGSASYWDMYMNTAPTSGYDVLQGHWYDGWCIEKTVYMTPGTHYDATLIPTYYTSLPTRYDFKDIDGDTNWPEINYIVNHYTPGVGGFDQTEIQDAIWYFTEKVSSVSGDALTIVNDALANGEDFVPGPGDWMCVILDTAANVQGTFILVDP